MGKYRKKPIVIEAIQFDGQNHQEILDWSGGAVHSAKPYKQDYYALEIKTLEGVMEAYAGDWIIKGVKGEFYPCKSDIFDATYEPVETPPLPAPPAT